MAVATRTALQTPMDVLRDALNLALKRKEKKKKSYREREIILAKLILMFKEETKRRSFVQNDENPQKPKEQVRRTRLDSFNSIHSHIYIPSFILFIHPFIHSFIIYSLFSLPHTYTVDCTFVTQSIDFILRACVLTLPSGEWISEVGTKLFTLVPVYPAQSLRQPQRFTSSQTKTLRATN